MKKTVLFLLSIFVVTSLVSCGNKQSKAYVYEDAIESSVMYDMEAPVASKAMVTSNSKRMVSESVIESEEAISNDYIVTDRKLIKNGFVTLEVESFDEMDSIIRSMVASYNGYVTDTNSNERYMNFTVKIPSEYFDAAMDMTGKIGKVKYKSENAMDVTDEFYDLDSRINTKKILKEKFESYLAQAKDMKDLLEIERQLNEVVTDLEQIEGRMKRLSNQIAYSTINITLDLPIGYTETGFEWPDLGNDFREFGGNVVQFFAGLIIFIFYFVVYGVPIAAIIAFLYWLLFGRIGLFIKLFKFLSKKKK